MDIIHPTYIMVGLICTVFGIGFSVGSFRFTFVSKEKCEILRKECPVNLSIEKLNESLKRVEDRLDELILKQIK